MNLADHPNKAFFFTDDDEIKTLLTKEGLIHHLEKGSAEAGALPNQTRWHEFFGHPTHWILALQFFGFQRPEENGYHLRCFPKRMMTRRQFESQMKSEKHQHFTQSHTRSADGGPPSGTS